MKLLVDDLDMTWTLFAKFSFRYHWLSLDCRGGVTPNTLTFNFTAFPKQVDYLSLGSLNCIYGKPQTLYY
jgi:hypothetical protein